MPRPTTRRRLHSLSVIRLPASIRRCTSPTDTLYLQPTPLAIALALALAALVTAACTTPSTHISVEATVAARPQQSPTSQAAHPTPLPFPTPTPGGPKLPLEVVRLTDYQLGGAWYVVGDVRNNDTLPRRLVHVAVSFLDDTGKVLGAHIAYVSGPEIVPPGGTAPFALSAPPDPRVARLRLDVRGFAVVSTPTPTTASRP